MTRISISKHHQSYLDAIAKQMGCSASEALNYLLWQLRKENFSFTSSLTQSNSFYDSSTFEKDTKLGFYPKSLEAVQEFEACQKVIDSVIEPEIDPVIQRLIDAGLEMSF